jgi:hypothetical protein
MRASFPLDRLGRIEWKVFLIGLKVREGDALLYKYREVKRKQIGGLQVFIETNDNKHPRSTNDMNSFTRPRNMHGSFPLAATICRMNKIGHVRHQTLSKVLFVCACLNFPLNQSIPSA